MIALIATLSMGLLGVAMASKAASPLTTSPLAPKAIPPDRSFFVSTTGSDRNAGNKTNPFRSITHGVSRLRAGDTLYIEEGTYRESIDMGSSGTPNAMISVIGVGNVVIDNSGMDAYDPALETKGHDYLRFENLTVRHSRAGVEVSPGSTFIEVDGLRTDGNHFAVKINSASNVTVKNTVAANGRNGFRTESVGGAAPSRILFENIEVFGSKDIYSGYESKYRNGDGFILEAGHDITIRNVKSYDHWDAGLDIKATGVLVENAEVWGNKQGFKIWGRDIVVRNALVRNNKVFVGDPVSGEGHGVNARRGSVVFTNSTFVDNEAFDIVVDNDGGPASVTIENSIIAHRAGGRLLTNLGGSLTDRNNLWYWKGHSDPGFSISCSSIWADPEFVDWDKKDFLLRKSSPAANRGSRKSDSATTDQDRKALD